MRIIALLVMVFGVALGGGAVFFASKYFNDMKASMAQKQPDTVRILVAKTALAYPMRVAPNQLQWVEWPRAAVPKGAFTSVAALFGKDGKAKRIVLKSIAPGEPVLDSKLAKPGESPRIAANLTGNKRAVSIPIDAISGVSGFVSPGDRVDIMLIRQQQGQLTSSVILQDITIIAVDQRINTEGVTPRMGQTVTVSVDTYDAQKLALAQSLGRLSLILRGATESGKDQAPIQPLTEDSLNDLAGPKKTTSTSTDVIVRRAGATSIVKFTNGQESVPPGQPNPDQSGGGQKKVGGAAGGN